MNDSPLGLFITWTVYGTFLPGDQRGWRHRRDGQRTPQPKLEKWTRDRLKHDVRLLDARMRSTAQSAIEEIASFRLWTLWAVSVRTNHAHAVLTAPGYDPALVRDQLKAKATRELRLVFPVWKHRPIWADKGDVQYLDSEADVQECVLYVSEAQDRKDRGVSRESLDTEF